jgi:hypothetical protein
MAEAGGAGFAGLTFAGLTFVKPQPLAIDREAHP